jgi:glycosyltransferase involved in cell wall biosynthesis
VSTLPNTLFFYIELLKSLRALGTRLTLITSENPLLEKLIAPLDCQVETVSFTRSITPAHDWRAYRRLTAVFRNTRYDLIHAHTPKAGFLAMHTAAKASDAVRVYTVHGLVGETAPWLKRRFFYFCEKQTCRHAHQVLTVSQSLRRRLLEEGICSADKLSILSQGSACGIDVQNLYKPSDLLGREAQQIRRQFGIPQEAVVLGFVGRLTPEKGIPMFLEVFEKLSMQNPQLHLLLVGRIDEVREKLDARSLSLLKEHPRIHWAGQVPFPAAYYAAMDIFVMPSRREGFGMCNIEAAAMGLPVVATRVTGCVDSVQDGRTGLLFEKDNPEGLTRCLLRLIEDPLLRKQLGQEGARWVREHFSSERLVQEHLQFYERLLANH